MKTIRQPKPNWPLFTAAQDGHSEAVRRHDVTDVTYIGKSISHSTRSTLHLADVAGSTGDCECEPVWFHNAAAHFPQFHCGQLYSLDSSLDAPVGLSANGMLRRQRGLPWKRDPGPVSSGRSRSLRCSSKAVLGCAQNTVDCQSNQGAHCGRIR